MGYDYIAFDEHHFNEDLQWADAVPMFRRLPGPGRREGAGVRPEALQHLPGGRHGRGELPGQEMYMSGRSLFPLTIEMCNRICPGLRRQDCASPSPAAPTPSTCGRLFAAGIWPITAATTILKPGGYNRLRQMVEETRGHGVPALLRHGQRRHRGPARMAARTDPLPLQGHQAPALPQERGARSPAGLLHRPPARAAAPSSRTSPSIWSSAARVSTVRP